MLQQKNILTLRPVEAFIIAFLLLAVLSFSIIQLQLTPHVPIILTISVLIIYGLFKKVSISELESALMEGAKSGLGAIMIFFLIGMLISSWMASGTIPTFIFLAFEMMSGKWFYAITFVVTSVIGVAIGSSLTTAATIGAAFMGIAGAFGLSPAMTAGAIVSGAFFGDKMSPLSDTTTLASSTVKVDLFEHIKNMAWTTVPAFILTFVIFFILSPDVTGANFANAEIIKQELLAMNLVHWYSLIPFVVLAVLAMKKIPAFITLGAGTFTAMIISLIHTNESEWVGLLASLYSGYIAESDVAEVVSLLSRGGVESMLFSVSLVFLALAMGGLLFKLGVLQALVAGVHHGMSKISVLLSSTAATTIGINFLVGEQYLSIILTGNMFEPHYRRAGLHPKNLSRILEDAGTVINPLVPWSVCGVFLTGVLGVPTIEYAFFAFFCLLSPILTVLVGITKISITKLDDQSAVQKTP